MVRRTRASRRGWKRSGWKRPTRILLSMQAVRSCLTKMAIRKLIQTETDESRDGRTRESAELYRELLVQIGEDPQRDGLVRTPERAAKAMEYLTRGYRT